MFSLSSVFAAYASLSGYLMMITPMIERTVPPPLQNFIISYLNSYFLNSTAMTLIIDNHTKNGMCNELYAAAQVYLSTKIIRNATRLNISRESSEKSVGVYLGVGEEVSDVYDGVEIKWRFLVNTKKIAMVDDFGEPFNKGILDQECFELSFDKKHRDLVLDSYVPYVERKAKDIKNERRILKMHSYCNRTLKWKSVNLEHPSTFDKMAMKDELKRSLMGDLDRFIRRKNFYKRAGKAWKRGYLLYGPPGTGKTSLVAAMANHLKFDIYDLQLASVKDDADLRKILLGTKNRSILLVEDIDCSVDLPTTLQPKTHDDSKGSEALTLSGLLNCIDGLWSSCGEERIVIFTTNNKERLDQALLRPGRMDMHIHMGHCCFEGFKTLASNYLGLSHDDSHHLYPEIKRLIHGEVLTPAEVAEELMKNEDADAALKGLVRVLKMKRSWAEKYANKT